MTTIEMPASSWDLSDQSFWKSVSELSGELHESMADIGDVRLVSFDDMVAHNVKSDNRPKSVDAIYITNRYIVFVEFKGSAILFIEPELMDEKKKSERAELLDAVQRKASETLCLYHRFLKDDERVTGLKTRFILVGQDPISEMISVISRHTSMSNAKTPPEIIKFGIHDKDGTPLFYDEVESFTSSEFPIVIKRSMKNHRLLLPPARGAFQIIPTGSSTHLWA